MKVVERIAAGEVVQDSESAEVKEESKVGCLQLLQNPQQRFNTIIFTLVWFSLAGIYYGIGFNTKNLGGDPYINLVYMGLTEAIGFPTAIFANKWYVRQYLICDSILLEFAYKLVLIYCAAGLAAEWHYWDILHFQPWH